MRDFLFCVVILIANIIQAITGFAGTVLAMPFSIMLVGYSTARPILNAIGIVAGLMVVYKERQYVLKSELIKILSLMAVGFTAGLFLKSHIAAQYDKVLYVALGVIVIALAANGIYHEYSRKKTHPMKLLPSVIMLLAAGIVHGVFVCGGPLVVSYLSTRGKGKNAFRATLSCVWVVLNSIMMFDDVRTGDFTLKMLPLFGAAIGVIIVATLIGQRLAQKFSRDAFMKVSYALMIVSGVSIILK